MFTFVIDSDDALITQLCYRHVTISVIVIMQQLIIENIRSQNSCKHHLINITAIFIITCIRICSVKQYFNITNDETERYPIISFYLKILNIFNVASLIGMAIVVLGLCLMIIIKCLECCCPASFMRTTHLQSLLINIENTVSTQQSREAVNFIISHIHKSKYHVSVDSEVKMCPICLIEYAEGVEIITLPCDMRHCFHSECIQAWISGEGKISCPICRKDVAEEIKREQEEIRPRQEENKTAHEDVKKNEVIIELGNEQ